MIKLIGKELFQWNKGRKVLIENNQANEAVFSADNINGIKREIINGEAEIPSVLLQDAKSITVYIAIKDNDSYETLYRKTFTVIPAAKPDGYIEEEIGEETIEKLENIANLLYNGNVNEVLVFTDEGPKWKTINLPSDDNDENETTVCAIKTLINDSDTPIYFTEMESGVYILRGLFESYRARANYLKGYTFNFDLDTFVVLRTNKDAMSKENAATAFVQYSDTLKTELHIITRFDETSSGYSEYIKEFGADSVPRVTNAQYPFDDLTDFNLNTNTLGETASGYAAYRFAWNPKTTLIHTTKTAYSKDETKRAIEEAKEVYVGSDEPPESAVLHFDTRKKPFKFKPDAKTEAMTLPVGMDENGKLWAEGGNSGDIPTGGGGTAFTDVVITDVTLEEEVSSISIDCGNEATTVINECDQLFFFAMFPRPLEQAERGNLTLYLSSTEVGSYTFHGAYNKAIPSSSCYHEKQYFNVRYDIIRNPFIEKPTDSSPRVKTTSVPNSDAQTNYLTNQVVVESAGNGLYAKYGTTLKATTTTVFAAGTQFIVIARRYNR